MTRFGLLPNTVHIHFLKICSLASELKIKSNFKLFFFFQHLPQIPPFVSSCNKQRKILIFYSPCFLEHNAISMPELNLLNLNNFFLREEFAFDGVWWLQTDNVWIWIFVIESCFLNILMEMSHLFHQERLERHWQLIRTRVPTRRDPGQSEPTVLSWIYQKTGKHLWDWGSPIRGRIMNCRSA